MKNLTIPMVCLVLCGACVGFAPAQTIPPETATAWHDGRFQVDVAGVIGRSAIVLGKPNLEPMQAMPLGNGSLGVAVWSADGLTAQLNRNDTLPRRLSPGQVVIPGIAALTGAKDYSGRLDLYHGEFREQGGGMTATVWVEPGSDVLVVDVTGANPNQPQTALLRLWPPRSPQAVAKGRSGLLAQGWVDDKNPGASGRTFGSLSAITAEGRSVSSSVIDPLTITVTFTPFEDGHFRIIAASPHYDGKGKEGTIADRALVSPPNTAHRVWWQDFWKHAAVIKITSKDEAGEYMENLRNINLFIAACEKGIEYPGSQAGIADMISPARDTHTWDPSAFWHWNLRMQVATNIGAGLPEFNEPYFNLYRENLANIEQWTREHMRGLPGSCVPETMRFNGRGIENESGWTGNANDVNHDCDAEFKPFYNARTLTTGAEVSLWVWRQYLATKDRRFLEENYPLMASSARFLLAYQRLGSDGLLHTSPSNAHETQWDVTDPTTDIAAVMALYPATIEAAKLLGKDADLVRQLQAALPRIPPFPRTAQTSPRTLLPSSADGVDVIAESYLPGSEDHNSENIGLEPVWPYDVVGDASPLFSLARRTYAHRPHVFSADWSFDPIQAARLGLGSEVGSTLVEITQKFQVYVNGMAMWAGDDRMFYVEQTGVVADALQEALVQDYDGVIRIAPAIPPGWDFEGSVFVRGRTKVDVQTKNGAVVTVAIEAGTAGPIKIRNPWQGEPVDVISGKTRTKVVAGAVGPMIEFAATALTSYLVENHSTTKSARSFAAVSGTPALSAKKLGGVQIGLPGDAQ